MKRSTERTPATRNPVTTARRARADRRTQGLLLRVRLDVCWRDVVSGARLDVLTGVYPYNARPVLIDGRIEVWANESLARRGLLDFGNQVQPSSGRRRNQGAIEIAWRVRLLRRPLELFVRGVSIDRRHLVSLRFQDVV